MTKWLIGIDRERGRERERERLAVNSCQVTVFRIRVVRMTTSRMDKVANTNWVGGNSEHCTWGCNELSVLVYNERTLAIELHRLSSNICNIDKIYATLVDILVIHWEDFKFPLQIINPGHNEWGRKLRKGGMSKQMNWFTQKFPQLFIDHACMNDGTKVSLFNWNLSENPVLVLNFIAYVHVYISHLSLYVPSAFPVQYFSHLFILTRCVNDDGPKRPLTPEPVKHCQWIMSLSNDWNRVSRALYLL